MTNELETRGHQEVSTTAAEQIHHSGPAYSPDVDIYTSDDEALFLVELPGVSRGAVTIQIDENDSLVIRATNGHSEPAHPVLRQFRVGNYYRSFQLSDEYDKDKVSARLENGLLEIRIPRREEVKPRKIQISA